MAIKDMSKIPSLGFVANVLTEGWRDIKMRATEVTFKRNVIVLLLLSIGLSSGAAEAQDRGLRRSSSFSGARVALVVGISNYAVSDDYLPHPLNDSKAVAEALGKLGFSVTLKQDTNRETMKAAIEEFGRQLSSGSVGLFYYAGHAVQVKGSNYFITVEDDIEYEDEVDQKAVPLEMILEKMRAASGFNIVVLDACRDNPLRKRSLGSKSSDGLAAPNTPRGTFIAYAAAAGKPAYDGRSTDDHSPFTEALLKYITVPDLPLLTLMSKIKEEVLNRGRNQNPAVYDETSGMFFSSLLSNHLTQPLNP